LVRTVILNQHTNNYGDDAAGAALATSLASTLGADQIDIFYIWQKSGVGLGLDPSIFRDHLIPELSGETDVRVKLAIGIAKNIVLKRPLPRWLQGIVETAKQADDVFVSPAGSNIGIYKDWTYLLVLLALVKNGVRPIFFQNTIASSNSRMFNRIAKYVLKRSELNVREKATQEWLAKQGMSSYLGVDTALLLDGRRVNAEGSGATSREKYIALVPTRLGNWHRDFREFDDGTLVDEVLVLAIATTARSRNLAVRILPHLYGPEGESSYLNSILQRFDDVGCRAEIVPTSSYVDYMDALSGASAVVSMRYHGLVLAAHAGVPCVSLAYENKMVEAASYLGVSDLCRHVADMSMEELLGLLESALDRADSYSKFMNARLPTLKDIARGPLMAAQARFLRAPINHHCVATTR
jgi:polysaccharide pyruvyl transferase WcaK-like protein